MTVSLLGTDPKSVLCAFFKAGTCKKGDKCKFSHDLNIARKGEKRNIYEDKGDTMDLWDEQKLEDVVNTKHGEKNKSLPKTSIVSRRGSTVVHLVTLLFFGRFASFSWTPLKTANTGGSGNAPTEETVTTDMRCRKDSC